MTYQKILALLLAFCLLLSLAACKKEEEEPEIPEEPVDPNFPITLELEQDALTLHEAPDSVVSLSPAITALFYDLGEEGILDGVSSYAPNFADGKIDCGTAQNVDLEAVKKLSPDLLFTDTILLDHQLTALQQMGAEVLYIPRPQQVEELYDRAELILLALHGKEEGAKKAEEFAAIWDEAWEPLNMFSEDEKVSALLLADLDLAATGDVWEGQLLDSLSLNNLANEGSDWQLPEVQTAEDGSKTYLYGETVVEWNPTIIFYNSELDVESIKTSELYMNTDAVINGALYPIDWSVLQMQDMELPELLGTMVEQVYPEQWAEVLDVIAERKAAEEAAAQAAAEAEAAASAEKEKKEK
ncbi:MAG: hypothetical protein E7475_02215 [Ruminococcaceae bacterium]|nr:hypothetical protein [Oscillospiraceae bacterium]